MVRTKAGGGGGGGTYRKVVAARAPRKVLGSSSVNAGPPPPPAKRAESRPVGGNPVRVRPTPAWQRGIGEFLRRPQKEKAAAAGGEAAGGSGAARVRPLPPDPTEDGTSSEEE
ncbi:PCNA-associated factor isoform X1 [Struthio camelus]|uniref:PCNA-associated factor isoform X1 n=1 Tax=Struthio camelus TaxID=8801 RepID=UPI003603ED0D